MAVIGRIRTRIAGAAAAGPGVAASLEATASAASPVGGSSGEAGAVSQAPMEDEDGEAEPGKGASHAGAKESNGVAPANGARTGDPAVVLPSLPTDPIVANPIEGSLAFRSGSLRAALRAADSVPHSKSAPRIRVEVRFGSWNDCKAEHGKMLRRASATPSSGTLVSADDARPKVTLTENAAAHRTAVQALNEALAATGAPHMADPGGPAAAGSGVPPSGASHEGAWIEALRPSQLPMLAPTSLVAFAVYRPHSLTGAAVEGGSEVGMGVGDGGGGGSLPAPASACCGCCSSPLRRLDPCFVCVRCHAPFCSSCDELVHEVAHVCPGCSLE